MQCFVDGQCIRNCIVFEMVIIAKRYFGTPTRINGRNHRSFASWQVVRSPGSSNLLLLQIDQICADKRILDFGERTCRGGTSSSIHEPTASSKSGISSGEQPFSKLLDQDGGVFRENQALCRRLRQAARQESYLQAGPAVVPSKQSGRAFQKKIRPKGKQFFSATKPPDGQPPWQGIPHPPGTNLNLDLGSIPSLPISL